MITEVPFYDSLSYMFNITPYLAGSGNGTGVVKALECGIKRGVPN